MSEKKEACGHKSLTVFIPTMIFIAMLHVIVIINVVLINTNSKKMSLVMEESANYISAMSELQSSTSMLSETATTFCYTSLNNKGESYDITNLMAYLGEYANPRRPDDILAKFADYSHSDEVLSAVKAACENARVMISYQKRSIYLVKSVAGDKIPPVADLSILGTYTLSDEELALSNENRLNLALNNLYGQVYSLNKRDLSENFKLSTALIQRDATNEKETLSQTISILRVLLLVLTGVILIVMLTFFLVLFHKLVLPIANFSKKIKNDELLETDKSLYEANLLALSYNKLLSSKNEFEKELKRTAETDSLTGLPNRYSYNQFIKIPATSSISACVLQFDINNLKLVNDNQGHDKGDELIVNAAKCIKDSFLELSENRCYRLGGDEFAVIINNINEDEIKKQIELFFQSQQKYNVSIAIGYSYTDDISKTSYEKLLIKADLEMYSNKNLMKQNL